MHPPIVFRQINRRAALLQATFLLLCLVVAAVAWIYAGHKQAGRDDVNIVIGELRSDAADLQALTREAGAGRLVHPFLLAHATQLGKAIERVAEQLQDLRPEPRYEAHVKAARELAAGLVGVERALRSGQSAAPLEPGAARAVAALHELETALR